MLKKLLILTTAMVLVSGQNIDECLKQDSISCVQKTLYRTAKELFAKDKLELVSGISLVKSNTDARSSRSSKELVYDQEMDAANDIVDRQNTLENFISDEAGEFLTGRSLRINLAPAFEKFRESARAISESMPSEIRQAVDEVVEGRGKKKGGIKGLLPLLIAAKVKLGVLATLAYFAIGLMAKKAILASLISLAISAFVGMKSLWQGGSKSVYHHDVTSYNNGWAGGSAGWSGGVGGGWSAPVSSGGWSNGGSAGWEDPHAYSHSQAYSGYHH
ncbi:hypothetical protein DMN91_009106 [Ooceraea biroi]|uniref:Osiris n=1 Tax=Ooceraea biroi TaxID=2015173 RepID=A0A026WIW2_OOCBI|nr:uncharacterized protein LOC105279058 [Ooceraea biroi]EZA55586.1 hypothetical protein X777_03841 [Ooceraea biroi]RLU18749.1 hypothetical protein DMN91_009106 [Ooceraea biroi]